MEERRAPEKSKSKTIEFTVQDENGGEQTEVVEHNQVSSGAITQNLNKHSSLGHQNNNEDTEEAMEQVLLGVASNPESQLGSENPAE